VVNLVLGRSGCGLGLRKKRQQRDYKWSSKPAAPSSVSKLQNALSGGRNSLVMSMEVIFEFALPSEITVTIKIRTFARDRMKIVPVAIDSLRCVEFLSTSGA
jgi:hypothetical protein